MNKLIVGIVSLLCAACSQGGNVTLEPGLVAPKPTQSFYICDRDIVTINHITYATEPHTANTFVVKENHVYEVPAHSYGWGYMPNCYFKVQNGYPIEVNGH